ncbi:hypothetical protein L596_029532 [Steinernema carpocapsae]|uniref:Uncharacterized protein n=1 Tax=Steinernema carpocapsae TaxID=34508 RepID=A0A4V5ZXI3_STECR|nr:hypothetical protein L596_029532 [Steinernema carpocapsae]
MALLCVTSVQSRSCGTNLWDYDPIECSGNVKFCRTLVLIVTTKTSAREMEKFPRIPPDYKALDCCSTDWCNSSSLRW